MKDRTLKNQKKHINKTLKQFQLAKTMIQLSITGTVSVITASLSFYFCPGFSSQVIKDARSAISFVQTASGQKFHELEDFLKKADPARTKIQPNRAFRGYFQDTGDPRYIFCDCKYISCDCKYISCDPWKSRKPAYGGSDGIRWQFL